MAERAIYMPPADADAPLDEIEQAFVRMFTRILLREIRAGAAWWTDGEVVIVDDGCAPAADDHSRTA